MQKIRVEEGNVGQRWSGKKMEGGDALRTVECLRGRLLAERAATRNAKEETEYLENKLIGLEALLKEEVKSRNKAERRLKFLIKKLESLNILYVSDDDSDQSSSFERSEITSVSSTGSSRTNQAEDKESNTQISTTQTASKISRSHESPAGETLSCISDASFGELMMTPKCHSEESIEKANSMASNNSEFNLLGNTSSSQGPDSSQTEETSDSLGESHSELESSRYSDEPNTDDHSLKSSNEEEEVDGNGHEGQECNVDNSMALVLVDLPKAEERTSTDPAVLDATVQDVLDTLRLAKERLQISMQQRRMIKVG